MAKHIYHLPLQDTLKFFKENKTFINEGLNNTAIFEYRKLYGRTFYELQIKEFIEFFKIDKDLSYALKTINYFKSENFLNNIYTFLNIDTRNSSKSIPNRDFLYTMIYIFNDKNKELCNKFFHKVFLHFFTTLNQNTNTQIDYIDLSKTLAKNRKIVLKDSFGEKEDNSYFKIFLNDKIEVEHYGKSIKTLRKKAYKQLFYKLLDEDIINNENIKAVEARENLLLYKDI
ncbi:hypothetical protein [Halarcobacter sp.]|uniref:hypothetical protein n=1 Tax=Halarcobacter sp. TaxID=2321133 RepID=UPI0029F47079|nr:hypothetical protein [Halarcobacter sp.]